MKGLDEAATNQDRHRPRSSRRVRDGRRGPLEALGTDVPNRPEQPQPHNLVAVRHRD